METESSDRFLSWVECCHGVFRSCRSIPSQHPPLVPTIVCLFSFLSWTFNSSVLSCASAITSVLIGGVTAVLATSGVAAVYIPSAVSTVLKFRSGVLGSLRDKKFQTYRNARTYRLAAEAIEPGIYFTTVGVVLLSIPFATFASSLTFGSGGLFPPFPLSCSRPHYDPFR